MYGVAGGIACVFFIWCGLGEILELYSLETQLKLCSDGGIILILIKESP